MSLLSMVEAKLPPGFRFHPRDDELICDYLSPKLGAGDVNSRSFSGCPMMVDVDLNKCEPWDLPVTACVAEEWYFFSLRDRKYATGQRTNRATTSGYWKATGKDRPIARKGVLVGMRKTLVFYQGRAPKGNKTDWVMHEFRMEGHNDTLSLHARGDWVLCRVFYKSEDKSSSKQNPKTSSHDDEEDSISHSLPPLMDNYITFDQTNSVQSEGFGQVPCFSNSIAHNPNQNSSQGLNNLAHQFMPTNTNIGHIGLMPDLSPGLTQFSCDKKVLRTVLDNLAKLEPNTSNLIEGNLRDYLQYDDVLPSHWNQFQKFD